MSAEPRRRAAFSGLPSRRTASYDVELYCSACRTWSPEREWTDGDYWDDGMHLGAYVECPRCHHHHPPYDRPSRPEERATVTDKTEGRWSGFSDEELQELLNGCLERGDMHALPSAVLGRARALAEQLRTELRRRCGRYRGPGVYRSIENCVEYQVYGVLDQVPGAHRVIVVRPDPESDLLQTMTFSDFESRAQNDSPAYEWVRPLGSES